MQVRQKQCCSIPQNLGILLLLSICQAIIFFSYKVRNLGFNLDKDLSVKEHMSFISKPPFLGIRRVRAIRHYLTDDATKTLVVSLVLSRIDYCNSLGWSPSVLGRQTSDSPKQCSPSCSPCTSTCSHHSSTQTSSLVACQSPNFL